LKSGWATVPSLAPAGRIAMDVGGRIRETRGMESRILVVEDDAEIADSLVRGLGEEGFDVEHAPDGESARRWLVDVEREWDLIILDWWLPGPDGLTLLRRYRQAGGTSPVLFLTARDAVSDRVRGLDGGADDYLCKPFDFDELMARVRALVRRHGRAAGATLAFGDVRVQLASGRAERAGRALDLTPKEMALLSFFLRHPGEVLSRTRIYDHVWDENFDLLSNTLEVHVMELRRKLEAHGPRLIQTLRGRGYLLGEATSDESP
jgi:two-component system, OmpR family, copper resistance phosphate regulon response regulator CusR